MKIIQNNLNKQEIEITCPNCGSILEIVPLDVICKNMSKFVSAYTYKITCPICNSIQNIHNQLLIYFKDEIKLDTMDKK